MSPKLIDVHTHLTSEDFEVDRQAALDRALAVCELIIDIGAGTGERAHQLSREFAEINPRVFFTAGIHPHDAQTHGNNSKLMKEVEELLKHQKCVAVGECGLDYYYSHSPKEKQLEIFAWQMELAEKNQLPLMIHTRDAEDDTIRLLDGFKGHAVFHCFTGSQKLADFGIRKGFRISFSGIATFKSAEELRKVARSIPKENILIETDSPYLAPIPMRGKRNESAFIIHTAHFLAKELKMDENEFIQQTRSNSFESFPRLQATTPISPDKI